MRGESCDRVTSERSDLGGGFNENIPIAFP